MEHMAPYSIRPNLSFSRSQRSGTVSAVARDLQTCPLSTRSWPVAKEITSCRLGRAVRRKGLLEGKGCKKKGACRRVTINTMALSFHPYDVM